jgi:hypothetical protein
MSLMTKPSASKPKITKAMNQCRALAMGWYEVFIAVLDMRL